MAAFKGFPAGALEFLTELEANNDRDWFKANRARYDEVLVAPATALGEDLSSFGRPKLFRPWNDTRFHAAPPIKEHVGLAIGYEGAGGFYVELSLDGVSGDDPVGAVEELAALVGPALAKRIHEQLNHG